MFYYTNTECIVDRPLSFTKQYDMFLSTFFAKIDSIYDGSIFYI